MNWGKLRTVSSVDHMRCLTCPGIFLNVTFQAFVHHEWISTPAARVMAEVCWESQNLSGGNPNCLHGRTGLLVITFALSVWFGFAGLCADRPATWAQSSGVTGITGEQHLHFSLTLALRLKLNPLLLNSSYFAVPLVGCSLLSDWRGFVLVVTLITAEGGGTSLSWPLDGEEMNVNNCAVMAEEKLGA